MGKASLLIRRCISLHNSLFSPKCFCTSKALNSAPRRKRNNTQQRLEVNKTVQYFERAKLIDRIRDLIHRNHWNEHIEETLDALNLEPFVVAQVLSSPKLESCKTLSFFCWLKSYPQFCNNRHIHHAVLKSLSLHRKVSEMETLIVEIKSGKYRRVSLSFIDMLKLYSRARDLEGLQRIWSAMQKPSEKMPSAECFNIYLDFLGEKQKYRELSEMFLQMIEQGVVPNSRTYTVIIRHLVKLNNLDGAIDVFRRIPFLRLKHTAKQYSILIDGSCRSRDAGKVIFLLKEMQKDGILNRRVLLSALQVLQEAGLDEHAERIRSEVLRDENLVILTESRDQDQEDMDGNGSADEEEKCQFDQSGGQILATWMNPNALATALKNWNSETVAALEAANLEWNTTLVCRILRAIKNTDSAWRFFLWVSHQPGFMHDIYTISRMLVMFARSGRAEAVDHLLAKAQSEGLKLSVTTIKLIIEGFGDSRNAFAALNVFNRIESFSLKPNTLLCSSLIHTLVKCDYPQKAVAIVKQMMERGIPLDVQSLMGLMQHFGTKGDLKNLQLVFHWIKGSGETPDAHAYRILIRAYCRNGGAAVACRLFHDMRRLNLVIDSATKDLLVKSLWEEGRLKEAALVEAKIEQDGTEVPKSLPGRVWKASSAELMEMFSVILKNLK